MGKRKTKTLKKKSIKTKKAIQQKINEQQPVTPTPKLSMQERIAKLQKLKAPTPEVKEIMMTGSEVYSYIKENLMEVQSLQTQIFSQIAMQSDTVALVAEIWNDFDEKLSSYLHAVGHLKIEHQETKLAPTIVPIPHIQTPTAYPSPNVTSPNVIKICVGTKQNGDPCTIGTSETQKLNKGRNRWVSEPLRRGFHYCCHHLTSPTHLIEFYQQLTHAELIMIPGAAQKLRDYQMLSKL